RRRVDRRGAAARLLLARRGRHAHARGRRRLRPRRPALADGARGRGARGRDAGAVIALVTGASSGLGEATARRLARGVGGGEDKPVLVARREERLEALAAALGGATVVAVDLTDDDAPARVREALEREHSGRLDLLVNNAGAGWRAEFAEGGWENVRRTM